MWAEVVNELGLIVVISVFSFAMAVLLASRLRRVINDPVLRLAMPQKPCLVTRITHCA